MMREPKNMCLTNIPSAQKYWLWELPLWCNGIGSVLGTLGCRFYSIPGPRTVGSGSSVATDAASAARIGSVAQELHVLQCGQREKMKYCLKKKEHLFLLPRELPFEALKI